MSRNMHADMAAVDGRRRINMDKLMTVICFILLFVIVIIPIFMIIYNAFFFEGKFELNMFVTQLTDTKNLAAMWNTLKIALFATVFGTIMGVFYAWLLGRSDIPCKGLMRALFSIPYMFPPFLGAMAWDLLLNGRSGYLNRFLVSTFGLDGMPFNINSIAGIVFVEVRWSPRLNAWTRRLRNAPVSPARSRAPSSGRSRCRWLSRPFPPARC